MGVLQVNAAKTEGGCPTSLLGLSCVRWTPILLRYSVWSRLFSPGLTRRSPFLGRTTLRFLSRSPGRGSVCAMMTSWSSVGYGCVSGFVLNREVGSQSPPVLLFSHRFQRVRQGKGNLNLRIREGGSCVGDVEKDSWRQPLPDHFGTSSSL